MASTDTKPNNSSPAPAADASDTGAPKSRRKPALIALGTVVAICAIGWGAYEFLVASHYETTDNAYVQGNVIQITPQVGGTVMAIMADDTNFVKAGEPLVKLDPTDMRVALEQAEANLAQAVRQVRTLYSNNGTLNAQIALRQADVARAKAEVSLANDDLKRRQTLTGIGAVSKEELNHARGKVTTAQSMLTAADAGVAAAREQLVSNQTMTEGTSIQDHPTVLAAAAKVRAAYVALQRATLPAPVDGYVAKRTVQLGQRVAAGTPLMSVVPLSNLWVDANFKEGQLRNVRIGQPVKLTADVYGSKVEYTGKVDGLGVGTGSAFALLPAQNATGNWIKVVQRVPVRIELDKDQLAKSPLRVGLSMNVEVNISNTDGKSLSHTTHDNAIAQTNVYQKLDGDADAEVARVIAANLGGASRKIETQAAKKVNPESKSIAHDVPLAKAHSRHGHSTVAMR
jgi:membrane fusion protein (multidrug efflux system)